jgi:hypothetical protein
VNIGDLVYDAGPGMTGVIFDVAYEAAWPGIDIEALRRWTVLYEDGEVDKAYDNELEVISDNR